MDPDNIKIFLVDDDPFFINMLSSNLGGKGPYTLHKFTSAEECIENLQLSPDIIFLDHMLSNDEQDKMDGMDALIQIKKEKPDVKVIMLTAQSDGSLVNQFVLNGAYHYIIKEEDLFKDVQDVINEILEDEESGN